MRVVGSAGTSSGNADVDRFRGVASRSFASCGFLHFVQLLVAAFLLLQFLILALVLVLEFVVGVGVSVVVGVGSIAQVQQASVVETLE